MDTMKYGYFGDTGLKLSRIVLGTQTFGWSVDEANAFKILDYYVERGGNYLDLADSYNNGASESITGSWLKKEKNAPPSFIGHESVLSY